MTNKACNVWVTWLLTVTPCFVTTVTNPAPAVDICRTISGSCSCTYKGSLPRVKCRMSTAGDPLQRLLGGDPMPGQAASLDLLDLSGNDLTSVPSDFLAGVTRINSLKAQRCGLNAVPAFILQAKRIVHLDLSHNLLLNLSLDTLASLKLRGLRLAHNNVQRVITQSQPNASLVSLDLKHNQVSELPASIWVSLHEIDVSHNDLSTLPSLPSQSALRKLIASHNKLLEFPRKFFESTSMLHTLDLAWNRLHLPKQLQQKSMSMGQLQNLDLSHNDIQHLSLGLLDVMPQLIHLNLSYNKLQSLNHDVFPPQSSGLQSLRLSHNALGYLHHATFHHLERLRDLDISHNQGLGQAGVGHVRLPDHLVSLDLTNCSLTTLDHCQIRRLHDLIHLSVQYNQLTCSCHLYLLYNWLTNHSPSKDAAHDEKGWRCFLGHDQPFVSVAERPCVDTVSCSDTSVQQRQEVQVSLSVLRAKEHLITTWTISDAAQQVTGFRVLCMHQGQAPPAQQDAQQENTAAHVSPILDTALRSYTLTNINIDEHYTVCIDVLSNNTHIIKRVCEGILTEKPSILAGVLTGIVFLLPCIAFIAYIMVKDKKMKHASCSSSHTTNPLNAKRQAKTDEIEENQSDELSEIPVFSSSVLLASASRFNHLQLPYRGVSVSEPCLFVSCNASTQTEGASATRTPAEDNEDKHPATAVIQSAVASHSARQPIPSHQKAKPSRLNTQDEYVTGCQSTPPIQGSDCELVGKRLISIEDDIAFLEQELLASLPFSQTMRGAGRPTQRPADDHTATDNTTQALDHLDDLVSELQALVVASDDNDVVENSENKPLKV